MEVGFGGVGRDGRSLMAAAFADAELEERGLDDVIDVVSLSVGSTGSPPRPVREVMAEVGLELDTDGYQSNGRGTYEQLDLVVLTGCRGGGPAVESCDVEAHSWGLADPSEKDLEAVRAIRDDVATRVSELVDELETRFVDASPT